MYRIDTEKLAKFKAATTGLREGLEEVRDEHILQLGGLQENWEGEGADRALTAGQDLTVQMEEEIGSLRGLEGVLGNALDDARRLRKQSRQFIQILAGEESSLYYTGSGYRIGTPVADGVISLEESTVTKLVESCNHAAETAREIEDITHEIDELLGNMEYVHIDISDQTEKIRKDCKKVERLEEYGRSYSRYAEEFIELDRKLSKALEPYQSEENKGLTVAIYEPALWGGKMNVERIRYLLSRGKERLIPAEKTELEYALNWAMDGKHPQEAALIIEAVKQKKPYGLTDLERRALIEGLKAEILWMVCQGLEEIQKEKAEQTKGRKAGENRRRESQWLTEEELIERGKIINETTAAITELTIMEQMLYMGGGLEQSGYEERNAEETEGLAAREDRRETEQRTEQERQQCAEMLAQIAEEKARQQEMLDEARDLSGYSAEELKEAYERIPNYNILERNLTDYNGDKEALTTMKQLLSPVYNEAVRIEAAAVLKDEGLEAEFREAYLENGLLQGFLFGTWSGYFPGSEDREKRKELSEKTGLTEEELQNLADYMIREECLKMAREEAGEHPVLASGASLFTNLSGTAQGTVAGIYSGITGAPVKEDSLLYLYQDATGEIRGTVRGGIKSSGGRFFYDVGMSVGDTVLAYAAGGNPYAAAGIRAADTYSDRVQEGAENGLTPGQIQGSALTAAGIEFATETISFKAIFGGSGVTEALQGAGAKQIWGRIGNAAFTEGGGEVLTDICGIEADYLINGSASEIVRVYNGYIEDGLTEEEAYDETVKQYAGRLWYDFAGGFLAGGAMRGCVEMSGNIHGRGSGMGESTVEGSSPEITDIEGIGETGSVGEGGIKAIDNAIPNVENATINPKKLTEYALNPNHPVGGNKAKVFESALGYNQSNADDLMRQIYEKLPNSEAVLGQLDEYGQRYTVDIPITGPNGNTVNVRTGWIIKTGSDIPELTTLFVKD
ncbi:MAG: hypothetical protein IJ405_02620 [Lachnospiraceae bacterium]|nr:hypothetical protein [Lachnospiraceae bacterium]